MTSKDVISNEEISKIGLLLKETNGIICKNCFKRKLNLEDLEKLNFEGLKELNLEKLEKNYNEVTNNKNFKFTDDFNGCSICKGILSNLDEKKIIEKIEEKISYLDLEFDTFLLGSKIPKKIIENEDKISKELGIESETIKKEINKRIGEKLEAKLNKPVDFENPNVIIMIDFNKVFKFLEKHKKENNFHEEIKKIFEEIKIRIQINPIFIEGRYLKFIRTIPQTKWPCRKCKGKGCEECNFTGKQYLESVEELISKIAIKEFKGYKAKFHGAGREDIDVKMLGNGRPFVLEILEPKKRFLDLNKLEKDVNSYSKNKTEYLNLKFTTKNRKAEIKVSSPDTYKVYRSYVECDGEIDDNDLEKLKILKTIEQVTPIRVAHRRADKTRIKEVKELQTKKISDNSFEMIVKTQGGLYIKELISSDEGRTKPSVSEILSLNCICKELDVIEVSSK
ncbi:tRNA pseudouridine(54/55) synthase Pus10 [Methanobrevibacter curvatus]|uniref:tRNA pseudouridine synthase Pus10 n=1 Tax=Methanobrevibacter curvatus TaxID=49547 RepID=A0A166DV37_9EURY|nr:tRNA pseudouridine(54/55) synthase Pus10 [Methanobrevibacter curvatus]KZX15982.1 THUMP domain protein [Methanobrevibacter curvatus]